MSPPPPGVIEAFGLKGTPAPLPGGRNLCYLLDGIVFKPSDYDDDEVQWVSELATTLLRHRPTAYRLASPISTVSGSGQFVFEGWTASTFVSGSPIPSCQRKVSISRSFHADLARFVTERPELVSKKRNRFNEADRVTWGQKALEDVELVNAKMLAHFQPLLDKLSSVQRPLPGEVPFQLIHGDLAGNILFDEGAPPAIIDLTFYWRPAEYANAILVADGLAWAGEGRELLEWFGTDELRLQLLVRALYWRIITFAIDTDIAWVEVNLPKMDYAGAVEIVCSFLDPSAVAADTEIPSR